MKATNNTDTLFMDIFVELFAIAKVYFEELFKNADPGTYTIKDIYAFIEKNIETTKEGKLTNVNPYFSDRYEKILEKSPYYSNIDTFNKYTISYLCRVNGDIISIEKGNFKCSFDIVKVFEYFDKYSIVTIKPDKLTKIKRGKPIAQYTDDMLELVSLDLSSMTYVVNGDIGTAKNIQSIVLYNEIGKIVVSCDDGEKIECQFDGESILQSVLKEM